MKRILLIDNQKWTSELSQELPSKDLKLLSCEMLKGF